MLRCKELVESWEKHCKGTPVPCWELHLTWLLPLPELYYRYVYVSHVLCLSQLCLVDFTFQLDLGLALSLQNCQLTTQLILVTASGPPLLSLCGYCVPGPLLV